MMANRVFESAHQWNIYSSSGRQALGGSFKRTWRDRNSAELILADISITSSWMDRSSDKISYTDLQNDFTITLAQVILVRRRVEELVEELAKWLDSPMDIHKTLCPEKQDQSLTFYIGPPDPKERTEKTNFEAHYSGIAFDNGKWSFGVDQSCVKIFLDELQRSLEELGRCA